MLKTRRAIKYLVLLGGSKVIAQEIETALQRPGQEGIQWVLELCDILLDADIYILNKLDFGKQQHVCF